MNEIEPISARERKRRRTRRFLADAALRLADLHGFERVTAADLAADVGISRSTFFRIYPSREAAAIEPERELWAAFGRMVTSETFGTVPEFGLRRLLLLTVTTMASDWDDRFLAAHRLVRTLPGVAAVECVRDEVRRDVLALLAGRFGLDGGDVRLRMLTELLVAAWRVAVDDWVRDPAGGLRRTLLARLVRTFAALPESMALADR